MNNLHDILELLETTNSNLQKIKILEQNRENELLKKIFVYAYDPYKNFFIVKLPKQLVCKTTELGLVDEWNQFFSVAERCSTHIVKGNAARNEMLGVFNISSEKNENLMRRVLKKHLNIGLSATTINKIWIDLIPTFPVALATFFNEKERRSLESTCYNTLVAVEPKLDGVRCITIVDNGSCLMFSREGKLIENFHETVGSDMLKLGNGVFDGEIMSTKFSKMMKQYRRKQGVDSSDIVLHLFDMLTLDEWFTKNAKDTCQTRREKLEDLNINNVCKHVKLIKRDIIDIRDLDVYHRKNVDDGFEGTMIKILDEPYNFGRSKSVYKFKDYFDLDLPIAGFYPGKEGSGIENTLGGIYVKFGEKLVGVGSGFSNKDRDRIWNERKSYLGKIAEIKYQEETDDGSLRFPTFVCIRDDKFDE